MATTPATSLPASSPSSANGTSNPTPARVYRPRHQHQPRSSASSAAAGSDSAATPKRNNTRHPRNARKLIIREPPPPRGHHHHDQHQNEREEIESGNEKETETTSTTSTGTSTTLVDDGEEDDRELCLTCCEPIEIHSIGPCNHNNICNICCLRRRELYKDYQCWCKTKLPQVVFTHDPTKTFADFDLTKMEASPKLAGIYFETLDDRKAALKLWECSCTVCHSAGFRTLNQLKRHVQDEHRLFFCSVCLEHRAAFAHEQPLFTKAELQRHLQGDKNSDDAHQRCEFCNRSFYNKDHLYKHLTEKHESCHICRQQGIMFQYFKDYADLERHFGKDHFLCPEEECLEKKFVVFRSALDLHAHDVGVHLAHRKLSKATKREAAKLSLDLVFSDSPSRGAQRPGDTSSSATSPRRGGGGGGGGGGGRGRRGGHRDRDRDREQHSSGSDEDGGSDNVDLPTAPRTPDLEDAQSFPTLPGGESAAASAPPPRRYAGPLRTEWGGGGGGGGRRSGSSSSAGGQDLWPSLPAGGPTKKGGNRKAAGGNWARSVASSSSPSSSSAAAPPNFVDDPFSWLPPPPRAEHYGGNFSQSGSTARPLLGAWGGQQAASSSSTASAGGNKKKGKQVLFRAG